MAVCYRPAHTGDYPHGGTAHLRRQVPPVRHALFPALSRRIADVNYLQPEAKHVLRGGSREAGRRRRDFRSANGREGRWNHGCQSSLSGRLARRMKRCCLDRPRLRWTSPGGLTILPYLHFTHSLLVDLPDCRPVSRMGILHKGVESCHRKYKSLSCRSLSPALDHPLDARHRVQRLIFRLELKRLSLEPLITQHLLHGLA